MKRTIIIGTSNKGKLREIEAILAGLPVELRTLNDYPSAHEVDETADTFEGNAAKKATELADALGEWVMADDSGLEVDALGGRPGVLSARYAGPEQDDAKNLAKVLGEMKDVPVGRRAARFRCVIALAEPARLLFTAHGEVSGQLLFEPRGTGGFGYDPIFFYPEFGKTFAEVEASLKNQVSHRARALTEFRRRLEEYIRGL